MNTEVHTNLQQRHIVAHAYGTWREGGTARSGGGTRRRDPARRDQRTKAISTAYEGDQHCTARQWQGACADVHRSPLAPGCPPLPLSSYESCAAQKALATTAASNTRARRARKRASPRLEERAAAGLLCQLARRKAPLHDARILWLEGAHKLYFPSARRLALDLARHRVLTARGDNLQHCTGPASAPITRTRAGFGG